MNSLIALIATATLVLVCLPAWAGIWKDDFNDGILDGWQLHDFGLGRGGSWSIINGEVIAIVDSPLTATMELLLPTLPIVDQNDLTAEFRLRIDTITRGQGIFEKKFLVGSMGMAVTRRDNKKIFYALERVHDWATWDPNFRRPGTLSIGFEEPGGPPWVDPIFHGHYFPPLPILQEQFKPVILQAIIGDWYKIKVDIKGKRVKVYWDDSLIKEFEFHIDFPVGSVGFFIFGNAIKASFDDYVISGSGVTDGPVAVDSKSKLTTTWGKIKTNR